MSANRWSGTSVLVAGGAGFIGSHLIERLLQNGAVVTCLDNFLSGSAANLEGLQKEARFTLIAGDVIDPLPRSLKPDVVFNLACVASPPLYQADPVHTMLTSVVGTHNLLTRCRESGARFVLASTSEVYGDPATHPQTEQYWGNVNPIGPRACYDEGKRAAEALTFDFKRKYATDVRVARIFNTYGPRMRADDGRVVSNLVTQALAGADITIYGDGRQTRSFCFVDDMVDGLLRLASRRVAPGGPINLGNPAELTILDLANKVLSFTGSRSRLVHQPLPIDDPRRRKPDISMAVETLKWRPRITLDEGLAATVAWFNTRARPQSSESKAVARSRDMAIADATAT